MTMPFPGKASLSLLLLLGALASAPAAETSLPGAIAAPGEATLLTVHAEGAQLYECKAGADGKLAWAFREPIATLLADGSAVTGKVAASAPGAAANDIPWLKLDVISHRGSGILAGATTVLRINTQGGKLDGACDTAGGFRSAPYSADYVFLRKG
jgi:hypothetical protein